MNFQTAVALARLHKEHFDMYQFTHMESIAWAQSCICIKFYLSMYNS